MTAAQLATRYRGYAAQCVIIAQRQADANEKLTLLDMAHAWIAIAEGMERVQSLAVADAAPLPEPPQDLS
jgi:hypothetical protein